MVGGCVSLFCRRPKKTWLGIFLLVFPLKSPNKGVPSKKERQTLVALAVKWSAIAIHKYRAENGPRVMKLAKIVCGTRKFLATGKPSTQQEPDEPGSTSEGTEPLSKVQEMGRDFDGRPNRNKKPNEQRGLGRVTSDALRREGRRACIVEKAR